MARDSFEDKVESLLSEMWAAARPDADDFGLNDELPAELDALVNSSIKSYRYAILTQLLAKLADPALDCRSIQAEGELPGSFDARSLCHAVIVPFDRENHNVLGGSAEPYVNNPLRIPAVLPKFRQAQKKKDDYDRLCHVLEHAQRRTRDVRSMVRCVLTAIRRRLQTTSIVYPVPNRISHRAAIQLLSDFLGERSGGVRLQAVCVALFRCLGERFGLFSAVTSRNINAADSSTGMVADIECADGAGIIVLAVEVKDRELTLHHVQDKLPAIRQRGVRELLFLVHDGVASPDAGEFSGLAKREFDAGQNLYVHDHAVFMAHCLTLLGEVGRRTFLDRVGQALDEMRLDLSHRQTWRDLLAQA